MQDRILSDKDDRYNYLPELGRRMLKIADKSPVTTSRKAKNPSSSPRHIAFIDFLKYHEAENGETRGTFSSKKNFKWEDDGEGVGCTLYTSYAQQRAVKERQRRDSTKKPVTIVAEATEVKSNTNSNTSCTIC